MVKRLVIGLAIVLVAGVLLAPVQTIWDDGLWPLSVTVTSASGDPIASVSGEAFSSEEWARYILEHLAPPETRTHSAVANPFAGEPLAVPIPTGYKTRSALLWSSSRCNQMRLLVVIVKYRDGRREGRLVEIPDLRESRSLRVEFP
jgi:hypothetical protein